ncbi:MAG TPA: HAMP domain-containing sensor histidine kinase [Puia sp.]|nr:HAMP domain-containing sensor histidine kinase [Puia sp.]
MKLLNKTTRSYLVYSFVILLITIPLFYFTIKSALLHAVDRSLKTQMRDIRANLSDIHSQNDLEAWSRLDKDIRLLKGATRSSDTISTVYLYNGRHREKEPYREISGTISVEGNLYTLIISSSLVENEDLLGSILLVETLLLILLMGGVLLINRATSKRIWKPFYVALNNVKNFELNKNSNAEFKKSDIEEFEVLNKAIYNLFSRSYETYLQQKEFTENASHELQTPLAIFQNKLELLMQTTPLTEEQAGLIQDMESTNLRLGRLNKSLLLLAKIENHQFGDEELVNVTTLAVGIVQQFSEQASEARISIKETYKNALTVKANRSLVEILIINLLTNAIRYNRTPGEITIAIDNTTLAVCNTGINTPLDEKIFERFYKADSNINHTEGTGLGLAIVENICRLFDFRLAYGFKDNLHCFTVDFAADHHAT